MRLDQIIKIIAKNNKDKIALVDVMAGEKSITYGEYEQRCNNFGNYLINDFKINPDERVALLLENSIEICVAYYSICRTSGITVPLNFFTNVYHILKYLGEAWVKPNLGSIFGHLMDNVPAMNLIIS